MLCLFSGKITLKIVIPFDVIKIGDDIFLSGKREKLTYTFEILGKVTIAANDLYLGETESSKSNI